MSRGISLDESRTQAISRLQKKVKEQEAIIKHLTSAFKKHTEMLNKRDDSDSEKHTWGEEMK